MRMIFLRRSTIRLLNLDFSLGQCSATCVCLKPNQSEQSADSRPEPFEKCIPMALRAVTLEGVILRYCVGSYCKVIDFTKVQKLSICHCKSSDGLLAALCHSTRLPEKLEKFEFKNDDDDDECEVTSALDTFLCLVSGIKILTLDVCATKRLPTAMSIVRHAKTLEMLNAHAW